MFACPSSSTVPVAATASICTCTAGEMGGVSRVVTSIFVLSDEIKVIAVR